MRKRRKRAAADSDDLAGSRRLVVASSLQDANVHARRRALNGGAPRSTLEMAIEYSRRGWFVVPVNGKIPIPLGWQTLRLTERDLATYFKNGENIGGLLGEASGGRVDVDLDSAQAALLAPRFLPNTGAVFGRPSSRASHRIYIAPGARYLKLSDPAVNGDSRSTIVELRQDGHQTILPGSVHPSGERITWEAEAEPEHVSSSDLERAVRRLAAAILLVRHYPIPGTRHQFTLHLAGALLRASVLSPKFADKISRRTRGSRRRSWTRRRVWGSRC